MTECGVMACTRVPENWSRPRPCTKENFNRARTLTNLVNNNEIVYEGQWKEGLPESPQKQNSIPEVLDTSVCKAVVDMAVWDGQDNPGREWKLGMYCGAGTLQWQSIQETRSVDETGEHITRKSCQNRYEGNFENGLFEDECVEYLNDEMLRQGLWSKGKFVQPAYISSDNDVPAETEAQERETTAEIGTLEGEGGVANDHAIKDDLVEEEGQEDDPAQSDDEVSDENGGPTG
jgi:hypothetical protein